MAEDRRRRIWLDVDGTVETGEPCVGSEQYANLSVPPLGRPYNYNFPLFDALEGASHVVDLSSIMLFTAYDARGAGNTTVVLRCELLDWLEAERPGLKVVGVATVVDPAYGHGPGAYYRCVVEPCERAVLRKLAAEPPTDPLEAVRLSGEDVIETLSPTELGVVVPMTFAEVIHRQEESVRAHLSALGPDAPAMNKARLARYCLSAAGQASLSAPRGIALLDDKREYLDQVAGVCHELGVDLAAVHVTPDLADVKAFLQMSRPRPGSVRCVVM